MMTTHRLNRGAWLGVCLLGILMAGCTGQKLPAWVDYDGHRVRVEHNGIWPETMSAHDAPWAKYLDLNLEHYRYYYEGPPVILHAWFDVYRNGERQKMTVVSVPLRPEKPSGQRVVAHGDLWISHGFRVKPFDLKTVLKMWFDAPGWSFARQVEFDKRSMMYADGMRTGGRLVPGETEMLREFAYYTEDHPAFVESKRSGNPPTLSCTSTPGVGKTTVQVKVRVTPFDPRVQQVAKATRRDGTVDTMYIEPPKDVGSTHFGGTAMFWFYWSDDLSEPGTIAAPGESQKDRK
jgi:hypothetical protein